MLRVVVTVRGKSWCTGGSGASDRGRTKLKRAPASGRESSSRRAAGARAKRLAAHPQGQSPPVTTTNHMDRSSPSAPGPLLTLQSSGVHPPRLLWSLPCLLVFVFRHSKPGGHSLCVPLLLRAAGRSCRRNHRSLGAGLVGLPLIRPELGLRRAVELESKCGGTARPTGSTGWEH